MLFELKSIRKRSGLSQEEAAKQLDVPLNTYRNWEQMKTMPRDRGELPRLARFFGVTVEDLFGEGLVTPGTLNEQYGTPEPQEPVYRVIDKRLESIERAYESMNENGRRGLDGNAEKCRHNGVRTFGYELGADGYFALDEVEAPVVLGCFEAYADGMGMPEICAEYSWVRTKMGKPLTVSMLSRMLRNEKYRGRYSYGGHVVEGGMPRIVSDELFYAVQRMLAAATRRRRGVMDYLLTGKLFDEEGHRYQSQSGHGKSGRKYTYYKCPATGHSVRQDALEAEVARGVAGILEADDDAVAAIVAMVLAEQDEAAAGDVAAMDAMRSRLAENAREQSRMVDLAAKTGAVDAVAAKMAELSEEKDALERDLAEMERACPLLSGEEVEFWVRRVMGRRDPLEAVSLFVTRVVLDRARGEILVEFTFDGGRGGGGGGGGEKPNPRPGDCPGWGSDRLRMADRSQLIENTWLVCAIRGGFALVVPFNC